MIEVGGSCHCLRRHIHPQGVVRYQLTLWSPGKMWAWSLVKDKGGEIPAGMSGDVGGRAVCVKLFSFFIFRFHGLVHKLHCLQNYRKSKSNPLAKINNHFGSHLKSEYTNYFQVRPSGTCPETPEAESTTPLTSGFTHPITATVLLGLQLQILYVYRKIDGSLN